MAKFNPRELLSTYGSIAALNSNFDDIAELLEQCVFRDGTAPNSMNAVFDMNHFRIENLGAPANANDAVRLADISDLISSDAYQVLLSSGAGSAEIGHVAEGTGAATRTVQDKLRETLSVLDYIPEDERAAILAGTSTTNVQTYIDAAVAAATSLEYGERHLVFPAGKYCVGKFDLTGVSRVIFEALGTVQIVGVDDSNGFIFGSRVYSDGDPSTGLPWVGDPPFNRNIVFAGGSWLVGPAAGQSYDEGWSIEGFVECQFSHISASGEYGSAATGDRTTATIEISFLNTFSHCGFGNPGTPAATFKAWCLKQGTNNINVNTFNACRFVGAGETTDSVGMGVSGNGNTFNSCDVSVVGTAYWLEGARSTKIDNCYSERVGCVIEATTGNSKTTHVSGGFFEIADGGTALKLGSSENTIIQGGRWKAGTGCTFVDLGAACYGRTIIMPEVPVGSEFDTWETGTEYGHGNFPAAAAEAIKTSRVMFPLTAAPSDDVNTLDDYVEDQSTSPNNVNVTLTDKSWKFTKVGRLVLCDFRFTFPVTADANPAVITNIPARFAAHASSFGGASPGFSIWPEDHAVAISGQTLMITSRATAAVLTNADCSGKAYQGTIVYTAAS